jgi:hypothetical protein
VPDIMISGSALPFLGAIALALTTTIGVLYRALQTSYTERIRRAELNEDRAWNIAFRGSDQTGEALGLAHTSLRRGS